MNKNRGFVFLWLVTVVMFVCHTAFAASFGVVAVGDAKEPATLPNFVHASGTSGSFKIQKVSGVVDYLPVYISFGGTAEPPASNLSSKDYSVGGASYDFTKGAYYVAFGVNDTEKVVTITPSQDTNCEGTETVKITILASASYAIAGPGSATINLLNVNSIGFTLKYSGASQGNEGTALSFIAERTCGDPGGWDYPVSFWPEGTTATFNADFTMPIVATIPSIARQVAVTINLLPDNSLEPLEYFIIKRTQSEEFGLVFGIHDNTLGVSVLPGALTVTEGSSVYFVVHRSNASSSLTVNLQSGGTAQTGVDYLTLPSSVTFPVGIAAVNIPLTTLTDSTPELSKTVILEVKPGSGYQVAQPSSATITVQDNDAPVAPTVSGKHGNTEVFLDWTSSPTATSYKIKRSNSRTGTFSTVATVANNSFRDSNLVNETTYFYKVSAVNSIGEGPDSTILSILPYNTLKASAEILTDGTINVQIEGAPTDTVCEIRRSSDLASWSTIGSVNLTGTYGSFHDVELAGLSSGTYQVRVGTMYSSALGTFYKMTIPGKRANGTGGLALIANHLGFTSLQRLIRSKRHAWHLLTIDRRFQAESKQS